MQTIAAGMNRAARAVKLVFESLAREINTHVCSFILYLLIRILDLFVYITQLHECTNFCLLHSVMVNYFLVQ